MNTLQITTGLELDKITNKKFCGVFSSDELPEVIKSFPCGFVVNTDPSGEPGTHWVAFYFPTDREAEFFDSFGKLPQHYHRSFKTYLNQYDSWSCNRKKL